MDISWSTVFSSIGASVGACGILVWLCREWISARLRASIQHEYDIKLEEHKTFIQHDCDIRLERYRVEFNQKLSDHQTRFNRFHQERADAIKQLYKEFSELFYSLECLLSAMQMPAEYKSTKDIQKALHSFRMISEKCQQDYYYLRLFIEDEEINKIKLFFGLEREFLVLFLSSLNSSNHQELINNGQKTRIELNAILIELRERFRNTLMGQGSNTESIKSPTCAESALFSDKDEVKQ